MVARGWGLPAVVGAQDLLIEETGARTPDGRHHISPGDEVTLDGTSGEISLGGDPDSADAGPIDHQAILAERLPELLRLEEWTVASAE